MIKLLTATAAAVLLGGPAMAQWGGGDGSQAGAAAWCAARAAGKSPDQASWAASNALVNSMGGGFASNIATIITGGRTFAAVQPMQYPIRLSLSLTGTAALALASIHFGISTAAFA